MFKTSFFKKEECKEIDLQINGKHNVADYDGRGVDGALSFVPHLLPCKYELDLSRSDGRSWSLQNFNHLAPFSMDMWCMLASIMDEEIKDCKRHALLANLPTKWMLPKTWAMYLFSSGNSLCEESAII